MFPGNCGSSLISVSLQNCLKFRGLPNMAWSCYFPCLFLTPAWNQFTAYKRVVRMFTRNPCGFPCLFRHRCWATRMLARFPFGFPCCVSDTHALVSGFRHQCLPQGFSLLQIFYRCSASERQSRAKRSSPQGTEQATGCKTWQLLLSISLQALLEYPLVLHPWRGCFLFACVVPIVGNVPSLTQCLRYCVCYTIPYITMHLLTYIDFPKIILQFVYFLF